MSDQRKQAVEFGKRLAETGSSIVRDAQDRHRAWFPDVVPSPRMRRLIALAERMRAWVESRR